MSKRNEKSESEFKDNSQHELIIYPDLFVLRKIYCSYCQKLLENNEPLILLPFYETIDQVKNVLREHGIKVARNENNGLLIVEDSAFSFFGSDAGILKMVRVLYRRIKDNRPSRFTIIADMGAFYHSGGLEELLIYELQLLPLKFDIQFKRICCYNKLDFARLNDRYRENIIKNHYQTFGLR
jgi:hypothetical protein